MKNQKSYAVYFVIFILLAGVVYTACKDITPDTEIVNQDIELKLSR